MDIKELNNYSSNYSAWLFMAKELLECTSKTYPDVHLTKILFQPKENRLEMNFIPLIKEKE